MERHALNIRKEPQANEYWWSQEAENRQGNGLPSECPEGTSLIDTLTLAQGNSFQISELSELLENNSM